MSYDKAIAKDIKRRGEIFDKIKDGMRLSANGLPAQRLRGVCMATIRELELHYKLVPLTNTSSIEGQS